MELLLDAGADVDAKNITCTTPLIMASQRGYTNIAELLIKRGADVNLQGIYGLSALHYACDKGYGDIVKLLLEANVELNYLQLMNANYTMKNFIKNN